MMTFGSLLAALSQNGGERLPFQFAYVCVVTYSIYYVKNDRIIHGGARGS
jgi:hypothetical protein